MIHKRGVRASLEEDPQGVKESLMSQFVEQHKLHRGCNISKMIRKVPYNEKIINAFGKANRKYFLLINVQVYLLLFYSFVHICSTCETNAKS